MWVPFVGSFHMKILHKLIIVSYDIVLLPHNNIGKKQRTTCCQLQFFTRPTLFLFSLHCYNNNDLENYYVIGFTLYFLK